MKIVNFAQGTQAWHDFRATHFTASEAPAMMGEHKYQTRNDLLKAKAFGAPAVSDAQQFIFNKGHTAEAMARPIAEEIIGEELFPVTGYKEGTLYSASFDGYALTLGGNVAWEHKLWNESLAQDIEASKLSGECCLHPHYVWQLEQQAEVGQVEKILFMCSDGTKENCAYFWYKPQGLFEQLIDGWNQFANDLADLKIGPDSKAVEAKKIEDLPALKINLLGSVKSSNLEEYKTQALSFIESINTELTCDEDFATAEETVKFCKKAETDLKATKQAALDETADVAKVLSAIDTLAEAMRQKRLTLEKLVKSEKDKIKGEILGNCVADLNNFKASISAGIEGVDLRPNADFVGATKSKRNINSYRDAAHQELANAKIRANRNAELAKNNKAEIPTAFSFLFTDFAQVALKQPEDFQNLVQARIADYKAQQEAKEKAAQEAKAKAEQAEKEAQPKEPKEKPQLKTVSPPRKQETIQETGFDFIARFVPGCGFLPIVMKDGKETYRGEFQKSATLAIGKCEQSMKKAA